MPMTLYQFVERLPKVELHCHIEGTLEPEQMFEFAKRNKIDIPFKSPEEVREAYKFGNLQEFLDIYYQGMNVLRTEKDFYDLTMAYMDRIKQDNVIHTEIFFDPQGHTSRGVEFDTVLGGITRALDDARKKHGITSEVIMCFLRHLPEEHAQITFYDLERSKFKDRVIGVGLDSSEVGHPPSKFENVFARARDEGLRLVAHAGEEGPPEYIYEALDTLGVDRIDHGNRALEDPMLIDRLVRDKTPLTVCPLSNLALCVVKDRGSHPLKTMLYHGLKATVNSDDPAFFGGYMTDNYMAVVDALSLQKHHIRQLADNAIEASFASEARKAEMRNQTSLYFSPRTPAADMDFRG